MFKISGAAFEPAIDEDRLRTQMGHVHNVLNHGRWWTVAEIRAAIMGSRNACIPEASISAQIRNLRKPDNGGYIIAGRYRKGLRIYEYRLEGQRFDAVTGQGEMFDAAP